MTTVADRIEWILAERGWSARALARAAGLAEPYVSLLLKGLSKDPMAVTLRTLAQIADGGGVSLAWLAAGEGEPWPGAGRPETQSAQRKAAALRAEACGVWQAAIASVLAEDVPPARSGASQDFWLARIFARQEEMLDEARRILVARAAASPGAVTPTPAAGTPSVPPATTVRRTRGRGKEPEDDHDQETKRGKSNR